MPACAPTRPQETATTHPQRPAPRPGAGKASIRSGGELSGLARGLAEDMYRRAT
ncbi:hypothetical protein [Actinoplanes campanulatus]|uniref:hypothetical protein n=1 Tax=Actinoplanes campanulatus TaxID=113559 RepID=UPI001954671E|nr:hypothetical protein [Actinoplanes capillaceus]